ncbi:MAG TPA: zinc ribbon domain-containing protein [Phycisphaerales bacterium]|nr:zinc ribbon domain-containing protein [Phycisphaerales bacterium]
MPTYDYRCTACKHEFELFQSMKDAPKRKCPQCGKNALERLIGTGAAVLFKGSGFYETDYRSKSYTEAAKKEKDASSPAKPETSKDSTPAESKPPKPAASETPKPAKSAAKKAAS